jgi:hypothetical protein
VRCLAFTPNGEELVSDSLGGVMKCWDVSSFKASARPDSSAERGRWDVGTDE